MVLLKVLENGVNKMRKHIPCRCNEEYWGTLPILEFSTDGEVEAVSVFAGTFEHEESLYFVLFPYCIYIEKTYDPEILCVLREVVCGNKRSLIPVDDETLYQKATKMKEQHIPCRCNEKYWGTIPILEACDDDGENQVFQFYDVIKYEGDMYYILSLYCMGEEEHDEYGQLIILKEVVDGKNRELKPFDDERVYQEVCNLFEKTYED